MLQITDNDNANGREQLARPIGGYTMQQRKTIEQLAAEIQRQQDSKHDYIVPSQKIEMIVDSSGPAVAFPLNGGSSREAFRVNEYAHGQIAQKLAIPKAYYDRMRTEQPELLARNVNTWLQAERKANMVRTLDGNVRAFLSDKYRPIDNDLIAEATLPHLLSAGVQILSAEITETRLYIQCVSPRIQAEVPARVGQIVQAGITISNSEVGAGSVWLASLLYHLICLNGQTGTTDFRKYHIGKRIGNQEGAALVDFTDRTKNLDDRALMSALDDMTRAALSQLSLEKELKMLGEAGKREIAATALTDTVEEIGKRYALREAEQESILTRIIKGADLTQLGLGQAITNIANDPELVADYDRVIELQKLGNEVMTLNDNQWAAIQKVAA